ncbi:hypothetical protein U9M48_025262 [Paspalum notatum var. saurae]|uniref:Uncharacterized protein n=1 Tax=Paspalum notatum var. saurae TaxID=547442 RepID=A0AAQ3WXS9_PASNO
MPSPPSCTHFLIALETTQIQGSLQDVIDTFKLESSFPARARSRLVFPDPGGPSNKDILYKFDSVIELQPTATLKT